MAFSGGTMDVRGDVTVAAGGRVATSGAGSVTTFFDDVVHNGTEIFTGAGTSTVVFGGLSGAGPFTGTGTVYSNGDLRPGSSPGAISFGGDLVLGDVGSLTMEIAGRTSGTQHDHLDVAGKFTAGGDLTLTLLSGFVPVPGDAFDLLDTTTFAGGFSTIHTPVLPDGSAWDFSAFESTGVVMVVVPEPSTAVLMLAGAGLLAARRRANSPPLPTSFRPRPERN
jgi:hypothetical protein